MENNLQTLCTKLTVECSVACKVLTEKNLLFIIHNMFDIKNTQYIFAEELKDFFL